MTTTMKIGHQSLVLGQLDPKKTAAFSPNLHRWMRAKGHFFKGGGVLQTAYAVRQNTRLADSWGAGTLVIGYPSNDYDGDSDFIGVRLMAALCEGAKAGSFCYAGAANDLAEVVGFWDDYLRIGRCVIDPDHDHTFGGNRYSIAGDTRTCVWCGAAHKLITTPRIIHDESWAEL